MEAGMRFRILILLAVTASFAGAHEPITTQLTWTREISRIFYKRCVSCHRADSKSFALTTYDEARPWAKAIKEEVLDRRMPPWGAIKGFGEFRNEISLSDPEIDRIVQWVEGGAPKGDELYLIPPPYATPIEFAPPAADEIPLQGVSTLSRPVVALGINPAAENLRITAELPDGSVLPLLWVRNRGKHGPPGYYFREPLKLPKGTRLRIVGAGGAKLLVQTSG